MQGPKRVWDHSKCIQWCVCARRACVRFPTPRAGGGGGTDSAHNNTRSQERHTTSPATSTGLAEVGDAALGLLQRMLQRDDGLVGIGELGERLGWSTQQMVQITNGS